MFWEVAIVLTDIQKQLEENKDLTNWTKIHERFQFDHFVLSCSVVFSHYDQRRLIAIKNITEQYWTMAIDRPILFFKDAQKWLIDLNRFQMPVQFPLPKRWYRINWPMLCRKYANLKLSIVQRKVQFVPTQLHWTLTNTMQ